MADLAREQRLAAERAVAEVQDGMMVGLGTGRTASFAVEALAECVRGGLRVTATATSHATETLAARLGITLVPFAKLSRLDLTIDGADEIDPEFRAIKGGGGALLREKVIAAASDRMIVIVDSSKPVDVLGRAKLPVEVLPFAAAFASARFAGAGRAGSPEGRARTAHPI